jgi:hypothetical protein
MEGWRLARGSAIKFLLPGCLRHKPLSITLVTHYTATTSQLGAFNLIFTPLPRAVLATTPRPTCFFAIVEMEFNGSSPFPEGVISFLDTDLYKLTMQCAVLKYFPKVPVTYAFTNRTPEKKLSRAAFQWLRLQINSV